MKSKFIFIVAILCSGMVGLHAQSKVTKAEIKVFGNCGMCKKRIETALDQPGIKFAEWNTQTKALDIVYNNRKISDAQIHDLIAGVGHDTDSVKAADEVYAKLPFCCLYRDHDHSNIIDDDHSNH